ncbi:MAG TPA: hypothetical protein ENO18_06000, partial [Caldithrix sp.]|nr:hypothetical protein [Caldithrix sp.]
MRKYPFLNKKFIENNKKTIKFLSYSVVISVIFLIAFLFIPDLMYSRPGGGHSYSSGSSGNSGGGDGIANLIIWILLSLSPEISIPLVILIIVVYYYKNKRKSGSKQTISSSPTYQNKSNEYQRAENQIDNLKNSDPNFSKTLFLDFVSSLYNKYYTYFGKSEFKNIKPFLFKNIWDNSTKNINQQSSINEIVIGNINIISVFEGGDYTSIAVDIKSNYTKSIAGKSTRHILTERWQFSRKKGIFSLEPDSMRDLKCPNCGAASNFTDAGKCEYCETFIEAGTMQWSVNNISILAQETFSTKGLAHYEQEIGTDYPTIIQPAIGNYIAKFTSNHNLVNWDTFWTDFTDNIAVNYFTEIYKAWSSKQWNNIRHLVSDRLYESYSFWLSAYQKENLTNKLDNIQIKRIDMSAIDVDKFYESFTVRIY